jgi:hypothetical protein
LAAAGQAALARRAAARPDAAATWDGLYEHSVPLYTRHGSCAPSRALGATTRAQTGAVGLVARGGATWPSPPDSPASRLITASGRKLTPCSHDPIGHFGKFLAGCHAPFCFCAPAAGARRRVYNGEGENYAARVEGAPARRVCAGRRGHDLLRAGTGARAGKPARCGLAVAVGCACGAVRALAQDDGRALRPWGTAPFGAPRHLAAPRARCNSDVCATATRRPAPAACVKHTRPAYAPSGREASNNIISLGPLHIPCSYGSGKRRACT